MRLVTDAPPHPAAVLLLQIIEELCAAIAQATGLNLFARLMMIPVRRQLRGMAAMAAAAIAEAAARTPDAPLTGAVPTVSPWDASTPQDAHPDTTPPDAVQTAAAPPAPAPVAPHPPAGDVTPLDRSAPRPVTQPAAWFADGAPAGPCAAPAAAPASAIADAGCRAAPRVPARRRSKRASPSRILHALFVAIT